MPRLSLVALVTTGLLACAGSCEPESEPPRERTGDPSPPSESSSLPVGEEVELVRVVDGDTIRVRYRGREERVRYIGIDTPEIAHRPGETSEPLGDEATAANRQRLGDGPVRLVFDVERRDRYGRLLAYVYAGDAMVNETLVREGLAQVLTIPPNVRHADRFLAAQREARAARRGLWSR